MIATATWRSRWAAARSARTSPASRYVDWPVDDPKGQDDETVRRIVADLDDRVRRLLADLLPDLSLPPAVTRS